MTKAEVAPAAQQQFLICPRCKSNETKKVNIEPGQPGYGQHHAKAVCLRCNSFIRWLPDPKNTEAFERRAKRAAHLLKTDNLTEFERGFCQTMTTQPKLSPKQTEIWEKITAKHR